MADYWDWKKRFNLAEQAFRRADLDLGNGLEELRAADRGQRVPFPKELRGRVRAAEERRRATFDTWMEVCADPVSPPPDRF